MLHNDDTTELIQVINVVSVKLFDVRATLVNLSNN